VIVGGSILERVPGSDKVHNTSTVYSPRAGLIAAYRKIHLFDIDLSNHLTIRESDTRVRGGDIAVAETELGKIGLSVCYDLRFPELFRRLVSAGAEIVCLPSAFTFPTGAAHWEVLVRARAIENQVYFIAPNQHGRSPSGHLDYGHSLIVDPWGIALAEAADGDNCITAEVDLDHLARVRRELPCLGHRVLES
jgi:predicted amidohydrolase